MKKSICVFLIIINTSFGFCHLDFGASTALGANPERSRGIGFADEYRLAPNDTLEIKIIGQKELDTKQTIAPDGSISLPLLGRVMAQGQTLEDFNQYLTTEFSAYIEKPQVVVFLIPRSIFVIMHDVKKNTWEVKEAKTIGEARALAGKDFEGEIKHGDVISVNVSKEPDFWEQNWYRIITATAVLAGIYSTLK